MEIIPGKGLDNTLFGFDRVTLESIHGPPDKLDSDESHLPLLQYNELRSTFWLDEAGRLHWIQCQHPDVHIFGNPVIGQLGDRVISFISSKLEEKPEFEDYGSMESYHYNSAELELQVEYGTIVRVCFGHLWNDNDTPIYPDA